MSVFALVRRAGAGSVAVGVALAGTGLAFPAAAHAASITVDTASEARLDGRCSLREAVLAADTDRPVDSCTAGSGADVVLVPRQATDLVLTRGAVQLRSEVSLRGDAVVRGAGTAEVNTTQPLLHVSTGATATVTGLTLVGSRHTALLNEGTLTATKLVVKDGAQDLDVDGATAGAVTNRGQAVLDQVSITGNGLRTAAILNSTGATMRLQSSVLSDNAGEFGGSPALSNAGRLTVVSSVQQRSDLGLVNSGTVTITRSTLRDNALQGLRSTGTASLTRTTVAGNGLGIDNSGRMTVEYSTVRDNRGLRVEQPRAGGVENSGDLRLQHSAVVRNSGRGTGGLASGGTLVLSDTTVAHNTADSSTTLDTEDLSNPDGAGGVTVRSGSARLTNVTLARNAYRSDAGLMPPATVSGGLSVLGGTVSLANSVLAGNTHDGSQTAGGQDCAGTMSSRGYNLVQQRSACTAVRATGDSTGRDPLLGTLGSNGGPSPTLLPQAGSPLVDAGSPVAPGGTAADACTTVDQRGVRRPVDGNGDGTARCDIGAVERRAAPSTP